jgi:hypothetical protein
MSLADDLMANARERTGLDDFGSDTFHDGLVALVDGARQSGSFNEFGTAVLHDQAVEMLANRLAVEDWYRRHPEIDDQEILDPLFGLGLPRTGSSALSFLLAEDHRSRSLLTWEASSPAPPPDPSTYDTDPRIAEAAVRISLIDEMAPKFKSLLPSSPTGPTECLQILAMEFRSLTFTALGDNPPYAEWLDGCDMVPAYRYHERVLKLLQWRFPARPWRLKSPAHMASIDALVEVYPEARFVMTHRVVTQVIPSLVNLLDATSEHLRVGELAPDFADRQAGFWERSVRKALAYRDAGNEDRFFDIGFAEMRPDPLPAMGRLYDWLGVELTDDVAARMAAWWRDNPAEKQGIHEYQPEDYGIDLDVLRARFAFYHDRFVRPPAGLDPERVTS